MAYVKKITAYEWDQRLYCRKNDAEIECLRDLVGSFHNIVFGKPLTPANYKDLAHEVFNELTKRLASFESFLSEID